jgi:hypothetical protein
MDDYLLIAEPGLIGDLQTAAHVALIDSAITLNAQLDRR